GQGLDAMPAVPATHAVVGMYADKDVEGVVRHLATRVTHWHCATLDGPRGLPAEKLANTVHKVLEAYAAAASAADPGPADIILPGGEPVPSTPTSTPSVKAAPKVVQAPKKVQVSCWPDPVTAFQGAREAVTDN